MTKRKHLAKKSQLENVAIENALQLEAAGRRAVPNIRFNFVAHAKFELAPLPSLSVFTAYTLRYAVTLNFDPVTLTFDLWPSTYVVDQALPRPNSTKFERNQTIRGEVIAVWISDLMT